MISNQIMVYIEGESEFIHNTLLYRTLPFSQRACLKILPVSATNVRIANRTVFKIETVLIDFKKRKPLRDQL